MINSLITDFSIEQLKLFFRRKMTKFKPIEDNYEYLFEDREEITDCFTNIIKIGEADLTNNDDLLVITAKTNEPLTNRTGKKRQYEIAKRILKEENKDAAFFVFYDDDGSFRFSFIRANFLGTKRDFTDFKRYTYFVSKKLTNKTFISQISKADFNNLNSIQEAFNVEPLTKQFYEKLQHWYFWAINNVKFSDDAEEEKNGREIAIIRLITRLMFIWFMKVRNLIPDALFDEDNINIILQDFAPQESTYYKAILQNLFFATLNTKQVERKFRTETRGHKGFNPDFGDQNVFRYHDLFKNKESLKILFEKIPFLNGGLFECLDYRPKGKEKDEKNYIDGFTATKGKQPIVPNFLFFSEPQKKDISKFYGKKNKTYEVEGLINLLKSYNFTIDENEADDIEVALDPELLGSIFENLLASYNPETATTARKATGSFYTPREIVNYMTNESLKQYFITHLDTTPQFGADLDNLIKSNNTENPFDEVTSRTITKLIDNLRVVDPAVGSGAFPMAVLNKLVFVLSKIDPDNTFWKNSQINGVKKSVSDPVIQRKLIEQTERQFKEKNADYGRKLYLIEKCIYGVDIQQIAVEIAKLRFFISLLVDEKIKWDEPENNYGIEPLPNLDFKLMQGNSLISSFAGIDFDKTEKQNEESLFDLDEANTELIKEFEELKNEYQNESEKEKKDNLRDKIENCIFKIVEDKIAPQLRSIEEKYSVLPNAKQREKVITEEKQKLAKNLGFDDLEKIEKDLKAFTEGRKTKDFFLWKVYFAEVFSQKNGFDIVIGNPPYKITKNNNTPIHILQKYKRYISADFKINLYSLFVEKSIILGVTDSIISLIIPDSSLNLPAFFKLREFIIEKTSILNISFYDIDVFKNASVGKSIVIFLKNDCKKDSFIFRRFDTLLDFSENRIFLENVINDTERKFVYYHSNDIDATLYNKLKNIKTRLVNFCDIFDGINPGSEYTKNRFISKIYKDVYSKKIIDGKDFCKYSRINWSGFYIYYNESFSNQIRNELKKENKPFNARIIKKSEFFYNTKIITRQTSDTIIATIDNNKYLVKNSIHSTIIKKEYITKININYVISILNSKLIDWYYKKESLESGRLFPQVKIQRLRNLPFLFRNSQKPFEILVDKIFSKKELGEDTKELEDKIDIMVYKLYELTFEEVIIVDPEFALTEREYEDFEIQ